MQWNRWKLGVLVSLVLSLFVAGAALSAGASWIVFIATFCAAAGTHFGAFIKDHPIEKIVFESETKVTTVETTTERTEKSEKQEETPKVG